MVSNDLRKIIVDSYNNGNSQKEISRITGVNLSTIYSIIKIYIKENRVESKVKGGDRRKSLSAEQIDSLKCWIDEDCSITLESMKKKLKETYDISVCTTTIHNYVGLFSYSLKRISVLPVKRNDLAAINKRYTYAQMFLDILSEFDEKNIIFVDEVGFHISMRTRRGRSLRGKRAVHIVPGLRSRNISVCCGMSKSGILKYVVQNSPFNTITFQKYIDMLMDNIENLQMGIVVIVMDNVPFHKSISIRQSIENRGNRVLLLPPYSPFLNPIENLFSKWKQHIRQSRPDNESQLYELINNGATLISECDCASYYRHMMGFISKCLNKLPIIDE